MRQRIYCLILFACLLGGCIFKQPYDVDKAQRSEFSISDDAYHLAGQRFMVLENNEFEENGQIFYVESNL